MSLHSDDLERCQEHNRKLAQEVDRQRVTISRLSKSLNKARGLGSPSKHQVVEPDTDIGLTSDSGASPPSATERRTPRHSSETSQHTHSPPTETSSPPTSSSPLSDNPPTSVNSSQMPSMTSNSHRSTPRTNSSPVSTTAVCDVLDTDVPACPHGHCPICCSVCNLARIKQVCHDYGVSVGASAWGSADVPTA